jgi:hypothetical protein
MALNVYLVRAETDDPIGPSFGCLPGSLGYHITLQDTFGPAQRIAHVCVLQPDDTGANMIDAIGSLDGGGTYNVLDPS